PSRHAGRKARPQPSAPFSPSRKCLAGNRDSAAVSSYCLPFSFLLLAFVHDFVIRKSPITRASIWVRKKQSIASCGLHTIGSLSLNEVFSTTGIPVCRSTSLISFQYRGFAVFVTVCSRPVPSTCVGAGILSR